jgi:hypothetical protein
MSWLDRLLSVGEEVFAYEDPKWRHCHMPSENHARPERRAAQQGDDMQERSE